MLAHRVVGARRHDRRARRYSGVVVGLRYRGDRVLLVRHVRNDARAVHRKARDRRTRWVGSDGTLMSRHGVGLRLDRFFVPRHRGGFDFGTPGSRRRDCRDEVRRARPRFEAVHRAHRLEADHHRRRDGAWV